MMTSEEFREWRERMGYNRVQAAEALGTGRNQPQKYEDGETEIPNYIRLATVELERRKEPRTAGDFVRELEQFDRRNPSAGRLKEIVAVTMRRGATKQYPSIHRYYVEWFDSNGLKALPADVERRLKTGLRDQVLVEARRLEASGLGAARSWRHFDGLELLAIFTTDRSKALLDTWESPIDLRSLFYDKAGNLIGGHGD